MTAIKIKTSKPLTTIMPAAEVADADRPAVEQAEIESVTFIDWDKKLDIEINSPAGKLSAKVITFIKKYFAGQFKDVKNISITDRRENLQELLHEFWQPACNLLCRKNRIMKNVVDYLRPEIKDGAIEISVPDKSLGEELEGLGMLEFLRASFQTKISFVPLFRVITNTDLIKDLENAYRASQTIIIMEPDRVGCQPALTLKPKKVVAEIVFGRDSFDRPSILAGIESGKRDITVQARIETAVEINQYKNVRIASFVIYDTTASMFVKIFLKPAAALTLEKGGDYQFRGSIKADKFNNGELVLFPQNIKKLERPMESVALPARAELHVHTKFSALDSTIDLESLVAACKTKGITSVAITDHGVVHSFPTFYKIMKKNKLKPVFGMEAYFINDLTPIYTGSAADHPISRTVMVVFDLETTSLSTLTGEVIEIGAVKIKDGAVLDEFTVMVKPSKPVSEITTKITGITNEMLNQKGIAAADAVSQFREFCGDHVLVAHNAEFDTGFLRKFFAVKKLPNPVIDTLLLSRACLSDPGGTGHQLKRFNLGAVAKHFNMTNEEAHRALPDAKILSRVFIRMLEKCDCRTFAGLNDLLPNASHKMRPSQHCTILALDRAGLTNLYRLVSLSHMQYFYRTPKLLRSVIDQHRTGLLLGTGCTRGELFEAIVANKPDTIIHRIVKYYDFVELLPISTVTELLNQGMVGSLEQLQGINLKLIDLARAAGKPVIASGNVHYLDSGDELAREVMYYQNDQRESLNAKCLFLRSGPELEKEFSYLDAATRNEIIYENPRHLVERVEEFSPIPDGFYPPHLDNAEKELHPLLLAGMKQHYGDKPDKVIRERFEFEWDRIRKNRFSVLYLAAKKLVDKSREAGYPVGSRGSVGSSVIAFFAGISEVNPLPPHHRCPRCKTVAWSEGFCGMDLEPRQCPDCGIAMTREGFKIPFEAFTGYDGKKVPDIDLNFSGLYQAEIFKYVLKLFGENKVFRAGTIIGLGEKNALSFTEEYSRDKNLTFGGAEKKRLATKCEGSKRTIGQHPGGMIIIPPDKDVYDFTPIQIPGKSEDSTPTTHFDYHEMEGQLVKLDILGHDTPTILRLLKDYTGVDPMTVPLDDPDTLSLFKSAKKLGITDPRFRDPGSTGRQPDRVGRQPGSAGHQRVGTLGIPEFGTGFVREMLAQIKPESFSDLVRISGLSHGENVWLNNAAELVKRGMKFDQVICVREDIMSQLSERGVKQLSAFEIMESVRKGRGVKDALIKEMQETKVPAWYIDSCKKINYLFPKAHAVAYTLVSFRAAYFKIHHPEAFYAAYFSTQFDNFSMATARGGVAEVSRVMAEIAAKRLDWTATAKEQKLFVNLEVLLEMYLRGIKLLDIDLMQSDVQFFGVRDQAILPSLMAVEGLGLRVAQSIVLERDRHPFKSIEDLKKRTLLNKTIMESFKQAGVLKTLPESDQATLF